MSWSLFIVAISIAVIVIVIIVAVIVIVFVVIVVIVVFQGAAGYEDPGGRSRVGGRVDVRRVADHRRVDAGLQEARVGRHRRQHQPERDADHGGHARRRRHHSQSDRQAGGRGADLQGTDTGRGKSSAMASRSRLSITNFTHIRILH